MPEDPVAEKLWFTDRTRYVTGAGKCMYRRFLEFHSGPQLIGIRRSSQSVPLSTGNAFHLGISLITRHEGPAPVALTSDSLRQEYRPIIQAVCQDYTDSVMKSGLMEVGGEDTRYKIQEQACLVEGLLWGFVRGVLVRFLELFKILENEQEDLVQLTEADPAQKLLAVVLQLRPDFMLEVREGPHAGKLVSLDLKTAYRMDEKWEQQWEDNLQMAIQGLGYEERVGRAVAGYYILGVNKGYQDRAKDPETKQAFGPRRQRSPFAYCYALSTGLSDEWTAEYEYKDSAGKNRKLGKDWRLVPVWQQDFPRGKDASPAEHWAWTIPMHLLFEQFKLVGMFERNRTILEKFLQEAPYEEVRWQQRLTLVNDEGVPAHEVIPRSWNCFGEWGKACPYLPICNDHVNRDELYEIRTPHHEAEAVQAGMPVSYYEEEEVE